MAFKKLNVKNEDEIKRLARYKKCMKIQKCVVSIVLLIFFISCAVIHCDADSCSPSHDTVGARKVEMEQNVSCDEEVTKNFDIQLDLFMVSCLVVVGGSLGMVLLNMKRNK